MLNRVAVLVPAHNEQELIPACLAALREAAAAVPGVAVELIVAADSCTDDTARLAAEAGAHVVRLRARNVGAARAAAAAVALRHGPRGLWLATTDADSRVPAGWLRHQLAHAHRGAQVIAGTVAVDDWHPWPPPLATTYQAGYTAATRHIHGANLAASAHAYLAAGGFPALALSEDEAFVVAARNAGLAVTYADDLPVTTSSRRDARARGGFSSFLHQLAATTSRARV